MKTKTMQRFALLTVVSVLLVAFALFAVACGKTDDPKKPAKTLSSVSVVASETKFTLDENHTTILLTVGDSISFDKADFTVTAIYSDKTTEKITDFTIDASAVNVSVAGSYSITVTYKGTTASVGVLVSEKAKTALHISQDDVSFTYDGTEKDFIAAYDVANASGKLSDFLKDGKVTLSTDSVTKATNAGNYLVTITPTDDYKFDNGLPEIVFYWTIGKVVVPTPTIAANKAYVYNGEEQTLELDCHGYENILSFLNGSDTRKGTNAGDYFCYALLKDEYKANYTFEDENGMFSSDSVVFVGSWTIMQKILPVPTVVGAEKIDGVYHYAYTGERIVPTLMLDGDELEYEILDDGSVRYLYPDEAGVISIGKDDYQSVNAKGGSWYFGELGFSAHVISFTLADEEAAYNNDWENSADSSIYFAIDQATTALPEDFEENFKLKYVYTGETESLSDDYLRIRPNYYLNLLTNGDIETPDHDLTFSNGFMMSDEVKQYLAENDIHIFENTNLPFDENNQLIGYRGNNQEFTWAEDAAFEDNIATIGTYTFKLIYKKDVEEYFQEGNYLPVTVNVEVEVIKGALIYYNSLLPGAFPAVRSDGNVSTEYSVDKNGDPLSYAIKPIFFIGNTVLPYSQIDYRYRKTEDENWSAIAAADVTDAGCYEATIHFDYDAERYNLIYNTTGFTYVVEPTPVLTFTIEKRTISRNGSSSIYHDLYEQEGAVVYIVGAHYRDDSIPDLPEIEVTYTLSVYYKATAEEEYALIFPDGDGKYDLTSVGYYKAEVTSLDYDRDNFTLGSAEDISDLVSEWSVE